MTIELSRVLRNVSIGYMGGILSMALGFAMKVIAIRTTSIIEFGMFSAVLSLMSIALGIAQLGLPDGIARTVALYSEVPEKRSAVLRDSMILGLLATGVISVVLYLVSDVIARMFVIYSPDSSLLWLLWAALPLWVAANLMAAYLQGLGRIGLRAMIVDVSRMATFCVIVIFAAQLWHSTPLALLFVALAVGIATSFLITLSRIPGTVIRPAHISYRAELLRYSLPLFAGNLITLLVTSGNVLALGVVASPSDVAFYSAVLALGQLVGLGGTALDVVLLPTFTRMFTENRREEFVLLYRKMIILSLLAAAPVALVMFTIPDLILTILFGATYSIAANALRLITAFFILHIAFGPNEAALKMTGNTQSLLGVRIATVAWMVVVGWTLAAKFGYTGMIMGWGLGLILYNSMLWLTLRKVFD